MAGTVIDFSAERLARVTSEYLKGGGNLGDLTPNVAEILVAAIDDVFSAEGAVGGRPKWAPSQRALAQDGQTLQDTGNLAGSVQGEWDEESAFAGSDVPYGKYHLGEDSPGRKVPVRDWLGIDLDSVTDEVTEFVLNELRL